VNTPPDFDEAISFSCLSKQSFMALMPCRKIKMKKNGTLDSLFKRAYSAPKRMYKQMHCQSFHGLCSKPSKNGEGRMKGQAKGER
jgi:hypothetical protein